MPKIIIPILIIAIIFLFFVVVKQGIKKTEINECNIWKAQSEYYPDFYLVEWQRQQCLHWGIEVR